MNEAACSESERLVTSIPAMIRMIWITATMIIKARLYRPACVVIFSLRVNQMMTNIKMIVSKFQTATSMVHASFTHIKAVCAFTAT